MKDKTAVIILAAGKGTRMASDKAKVLHPIEGKEMIRFVVDEAVRVAGNNVIVVIGTQAEKVREVVSRSHPGLRFALQEDQLGTGHAVSCAVPELPGNAEHVLILCGDVPFIRSSTLKELVESHIRSENVITVLGAEVDEPYGYGRLVTDENNRIRAIVEEADATEDERKIRLINSGIYCVNRLSLKYLLDRIRPDNVQKEMYLTDIVGIAAGEGERIGMTVGTDNHEVMGINTPADLRKACAVIASNENP